MTVTAKDSSGTDVDFRSTTHSAEEATWHGAVPVSGTVYESTQVLTVKYAVIDEAGSGDNELVALVASKKIRVLSAFLISAGTVTAKFQTSTAGAYKSGPLPLIANSGFTLPWNPGGWFETVAGDSLNLELSLAIAVGGFLSYVEV